jgi:hypothetical protein
VCGWVKASEATGATAEQTATRLLVWMDGDPYGRLLPTGQGRARGARQPAARRPEKGHADEAVWLWRAQGYASPRGEEEQVLRRGSSSM